MLKLQAIIQWIRSLFTPSFDYESSEAVYNDVIPSGVHPFNRLAS